MRTVAEVPSFSWIVVLSASAPVPGVTVISLLFALPLISWAVRKPESLVNWLVLVGMSAMSAFPLMSWCSVKKPESLVKSLVFVGMFGLPSKSL